MMGGDIPARLEGKAAPGTPDGVGAAPDASGAAPLIDLVFLIVVVVIAH